jgi:hypothetical protein
MSDGLEREMMRASFGSPPLLQMDAVVQWIDPVNREVGVLVTGCLVTFYAPPGCPIVLRGEKVKLRLLQRGDRLRVTFDRTADGLIARTIDVAGRSLVA